MKLKQNNMTAQQMIENEFDLRMKLIEDKKFIQDCIKIAKQVGITAKEWNDNKGMWLLYFANELIGVDNKNGGKLRQKLTEQ